MRKKFIITSICLVLIAFIILIFSMAVPIANQSYVVKTCVDKYTAGADTPAVVAIVVENYQDRGIGKIAIKSYKISHNFLPDDYLGDVSTQEDEYVINSYDADGTIGSETINHYEDGALISTETRTYDVPLRPYHQPRVRVLEGHSSVTLAQFDITVPAPGAVVTIENVIVVRLNRDGSLRGLIGKTDGASIGSETW